MKPRKINAAKFKKQLQETVLGTPDACIEVAINADRVIKMKLAINLDEDIPEDMEFQQELINSEDHPEPVRQMVRVVIAAAGEDADQALADAEEAGITVGDLATIYQSELAAARERLGKFRYSA